MSTNTESPYRKQPETTEQTVPEPVKTTLREDMEDVYDAIMDRVDDVRAAMIELTGIPAAARFVFGQGSYRFSQRVTRGERRELQRERQKKADSATETK